MYEVRRITTAAPDFYATIGPVLLSDALRRDLGEAPVVSRSGVWVCAWHGGDVVAVSFVEVLGERAHLRHLWVDPQHRRRGVARLLLSERLRAARDAGCVTVMAVAAPAWAPVLRESGFCFVRMRGRYEILRYDGSEHAG
jgi:GNAT superfamily N-acetyltransferase